MAGEKEEGRVKGNGARQLHRRAPIALDSSIVSMLLVLPRKLQARGSRNEPKPKEYQSQAD